jgi:hypothetical protein
MAAMNRQPGIILRPQQRHHPGRDRGMTRFDDFQKGLGIAPNMLTRRLQGLVERLRSQPRGDRPYQGTRHRR